MDYRKEVREMRLKNKRMYELTGEAGAAQGKVFGTHRIKCHLDF